VGAAAPELPAGTLDFGDLTVRRQELRYVTDPPAHIGGHVRPSKPASVAPPEVGGKIVVSILVKAPFFAHAVRTDEAKNLGRLSIRHRSSLPPGESAGKSRTRAA
jgi:hypothetical protein